MIGVLWLTAFKAGIHVERKQGLVGQTCAVFSRNTVVSDCYLSTGCIPFLKKVEVGKLKNEAQVANSIVLKPRQKSFNLFFSHRWKFEETPSETKREGK